MDLITKLIDCQHSVTLQLRGIRLCYSVTFFHCDFSQKNCQFRNLESPHWQIGWFRAASRFEG